MFPGSHVPLSKKSNLSDLVTMLASFNFLKHYVISVLLCLRVEVFENTSGMQREFYFRDIYFARLEVF